MGSDTVVQEKERAARTGAFRHDALLCEGIEDFVAQTSAFVRDSVRASEPIFVAVTGDKLRLLREELGGDADGVRFADIVQIGQNPARLIPAWRDFVAEHQHSGSFRGLGEPIWPSRSSEDSSRPSDTRRS